MVIEFDAARENLDVGLEAHRGAGAAGISGGFRGERADRSTALKALLVLLPLAVDGDLHPFREGVHHRHAHAVQAARHLVTTGAELAASVQHGEHRFERALAGAGVHVGGDATAVVGHGAAAVLIEDDEDFIAMAGERLVHRVVDHLVHQVVQTTGPGGADVHARAFAHRLQAFQHLDLLGAVGGLNFGGFAHGFRRGHVLLPQEPVGKRGKGQGGAQRPCLKAQSTTDAIEKLAVGPHGQRQDSPGH
ncbi:MAG: hypothetical protein RLZZ515_2668 [Cyanobacteriota bacterium]